MEDKALTADDRFKYGYAYTLLTFTIIWGIICMAAVILAVGTGEPGWVIAASGTSGVMGTLLTLDTLVAQHYFRRAKPQEGEGDGTAKT